MPLLMRAIAAGSLALAAAADEYNYQNLLPGTQAAGMGGANVAFGDGPGGATYNPAGAAMSGVEFISVSITGYRLDLSSFAEVEARGTANGSGTGSRTTSTRLNSFPLNFGMVGRVGESGHALSFDIVTDDAVVAGARVDVRVPDVLDQYLRVQRDNRLALQLGPAWSYEGAPPSADRGEWAVGAGVYYLLRAQDLVGDEVAGRAAGLTYEMETGQALSGALVGRAGFIRRWRPGFRVGAAVTSPSLDIHGSSTRGGLVLESQTTPEFAAPESGGAAYHTPLVASLGLGYERASGLRFAVDGRYYAVVDCYETMVGGARIEARPTWNANAGAQVPLGPVARGRFGLFTNRAATPTRGTSSCLGDRLVPDVDFYGAAIGGAYAKGKSALDLALVYQLGLGETPSLTAPGMDDFVGHVVVGVLGGVYQFGEAP